MGIKNVIHKLKMWIQACKRTNNKKFCGQLNNLSPKFTLMCHSQASILFFLLRKSTVFFIQRLRNFVTPYPRALPCMLYLKNKEEKKNETFLPSEKEESQTLVRALIFSPNAHNESSYLSLHHVRIQECK